MITTKREHNRLDEVNDYQILNTLHKEEYDYIVELAAAITKTPIALINFVGEDEIWFKAKCGLPDEMDSVPREISFCKHLVNTPNNILQIKDTYRDERFVDNPLVVGPPYIRFYAGSPLVTPSGNVIGALCVLDDKPRELTPKQKNLLTMLAKKAMDSLENKRALLINKLERKKIEQQLNKVYDTAPVAIFELLCDSNNHFSFPFMSRGIAKLHPKMAADNIMQNASAVLEFIDTADQAKLQKDLEKSSDTLLPLEVEFRMMQTCGVSIWLKVIASPERLANGSTIWYGILQDITTVKLSLAKLLQQQQVISEIAWEQSHLVRAPLSRIMALINTINSFEMDEVNKELLKHVDRSANELDDIIRKITEKTHLFKSV